jgi:hypothetical protein
MGGNSFDVEDITKWLVCISSKATVILSRIVAAKIFCSQ